MIIYSALNLYVNNISAELGKKIIENIQRDDI